MKKDVAIVSHGIATITRRQSVQDYFTAKLSAIETASVATSPDPPTTSPLVASGEITGSKDETITDGGVVGKAMTKRTKLSKNHKKLKNKHKH